MKILLIGGTGFIGRFVIEQLVGSRHEISVLHRGKSAVVIPSSVRSIIEDANRLVELRTQLRKLAPDVVINFILSSGRQAEQMMTALNGIAGRVVALSSMDVYRACGVLHETEEGGLQELPLTEESELRTKPAYTPQQLEMGKRIFSWMDDEYEKIKVERAVLSNSGLPATILRLPMVYGPGDPLHRIFPHIKRMHDGRQKILLERTIAAWRGSKGFVENVANAIVLAATHSEAAGRIFNISEEAALTELEWARLIAKEMNWDGEFVALPKERMPAHLSDIGNYSQHWLASSQRIRQELGFRETVSRADAIRRTVEWELANPPAQIPEGMFNYAAEDVALA
ncbi:MAG TPA: NAD-dependent epimerase/dehydratase family protein [Terriglobales bacterium]|nr:NAD-dependent epimerase/dehydratase family protein [Terriglobales bacterium]